MTYAPPSSPRPVTSLGEACAEQVAGSAAPALDIPATYRNLDRLEAVGVVRHVHLGHGPGLYELVVGVEREYGLCEDCGRVIVIAPAALKALREAIDEAIGLRARFTHFPLVGRCVACRAGGMG